MKTMNEDKQNENGQKKNPESNQTLNMDEEIRKFLRVKNRVEAMKKQKQ